jgi:hypothetical protein
MLQRGRRERTEVYDRGSTKGYILADIEAPSVANSDLFQIKKRIATRHPGNPTRQLWELERQVEAYNELRSFVRKEVTRDIVERYKDEAKNEHPWDYATQVYVLKNKIEEYIEANKRRVIQPLRPMVSSSSRSSRTVYTAPSASISIKRKGSR